MNTGPAGALALKVGATIGGVGALAAVGMLIAHGPGGGGSGTFLQGADLYSAWPIAPDAAPQPLASPTPKTAAAHATTSPPSATQARLTPHHAVTPSPATHHALASPPASPAALPPSPATTASAQPPSAAPSPTSSPWWISGTPMPPATPSASPTCGAGGALDGRDNHGHGHHRHNGWCDGG